MYRMHVTVFVRRAFRHNAHLRYTYPVYPMTPTQVEESQTGGTSPSSSVMRTSATTMQPVDVRTTGDSEVCDDALVCTPIPLHHYSILGYLAPSCDFPTLAILTQVDTAAAGSVTHILGPTVTKSGTSTPRKEVAEFCA